MGPITIDRIIYQGRQNAVDRGLIPWAVDPVQVVQRDGISFGIKPASPTALVGTKSDPATLGTSATVSVSQDGLALLVGLVQPVRVGARGVWAIDSIQPLGK